MDQWWRGSRGFPPSGEGRLLGLWLVGARVTGVGPSPTGSRAVEGGSGRALTLSDVCLSAFFFPPYCALSFSLDDIRVS